MRPWLQRVVHFAPAVGCLLLAVLFVNGASREQVLTCDRAAGRCTWSTGSLVTSSTQSFALAAVREVRYVHGLGKQRDRGESLLVFASGEQLRVATDDDAPARRRHAGLQAFFGGAGASLRDETAGSAWLYVGAAVAALAAIGLGIRASRRRAVVTVAPRRATGAHRRWYARRDVRLIALVIVVAVAAQLVLAELTSQTHGTLDLDCRTRCRMGGTECLPGGRVQMSLDPGDYTVDVWAASGPDLWRPHRVTIEVGAPTRFVCEP